MSAHEAPFFIGVISGNSSAAIRNRSYISQLNDCRSIDIRSVGQSLRQFRLGGVKDFISGLVGFCFARQAVVSTNPKWAALFGLLLRGDFILLMGDPFLGDVSRHTSRLERILWWWILKRKPKVVVSSPALQAELKNEYPDLCVGLFLRGGLKFAAKKRKPKHFLSYFGDLGHDRDSTAFVQALADLGLTVHVYGCGHQIYLNSRFSTTVNYYPRVTPDEVAGIALDYTATAIIANSAGSQLPGKYLDFLDFPGRVVVIGFSARILSSLPRPSNYAFVENEIGNLRTLLSLVHSSHA